MHRTSLTVLFALLIYVGDIYVLGDVSPEEQPRIVIIGAGAAGIAAASKLFENGFKNVTILEAEDRIGGRLWTVPFGEYQVDLGGQWVTGKEKNPSFDLASQHELLHVPNTENEFDDVFTFKSNGERIPDDTVQELAKFLVHINEIETEAELENSKTIGELLEKKFDTHFKDHPEILANKKMFLFALERMSMTQNAADNWFDVAISQVIEDQSDDDEINWKDRGYSMILDILMKRYPDPTKELPVVKNTVLNTDVSLIKTSEDGGISISTTNGNSYVADHVIVTPSLGVLKGKHKTMFNPPLPDWKADVIEGLGFGVIGKIFLLYDKPFWNNDNDKESTAFVFAWSDADKAAIQDDPEKQWLLGMSNAATVEYKPNLLSLWTSGESTRKMEQMTDEKIIEHSMENLRRFLGKQFNVTEPTKMLRTKWFSNPHFRGAYSFRSPKSDKMDVWAAKLAESLPNEEIPKILFAGEATSPHHFATVHGAIESGWAAADSLIKLHPKINAA